MTASTATLSVSGTLSRAERETVITWSEADSSATLYTASIPVMRRLRRIRGATLAENFQDEKGRLTGESWVLPIICVLPRSRQVQAGGSPITRDRALQLLAARRGAREKRKVGHPSDRPGVVLPGPAWAATTATTSYGQGPQGGTTL